MWTSYGSVFLVHVYMRMALTTSCALFAFSSFFFLILLSACWLLYWPTQLEGWWTYEFCYGSSVIQRHIPRDGEEETSYTLGLAQPPLRGAGGSGGSGSMPGGVAPTRDPDAAATAAAAGAASGSAAGAGGGDGVRAPQGSAGSAEETAAPGMFGTCPCALG